MVKGLEETVPLDFISVPGGPFLTSVGDQGGFIHTDITVSPATGNMSQSSGFAYAAKQPRLHRSGGDRSVLIPKARPSPGPNSRPRRIP